MFANVTTQPAGEEPLSLEYVIQSTPTVFLFSLHNATRTIGHLVAQCMHPSPTNDEFVGMTEYVMESFHDLLAGDSEIISDSDSSRESHHPS